MKYNFDIPAERIGTGSIKWDRRGSAKEAGITVKEDAIPLWVADMDFRNPEILQKAFSTYTEESVFGYDDINEDYYNIVQSWMKTHHNFAFTLQDITITPGVVFAIHSAIKAFTNKGDPVLIQNPVYYPFSDAIKILEREIISSDLVYTENSYKIDFDDFKKKLKMHKPKLFVFCSPHNPVSRVWSKEELNEIANLCAKYNCIIFSDEIHMDFTYSENHKHIVFSNANKNFENLIIATSPSKSFNIAGLQIASIIIKNKILRNKFRNELKKTGYFHPNSAGVIATKAVYSEGADWLKEAKKYIYENYLYLKNNIAKPALVTPLEGTYLSWVNYREVSKTLGISDFEFAQKVVKEANTWLDSGHIFGDSGEGFLRFNLATQRKNIEETVKRINQLYL